MWQLTVESKTARKRDPAAEYASSARSFSREALNDHFGRNVPLHTNLELSVPNSDLRTQKRNASSLQRNQMLYGLWRAWSAFGGVTVRNTAVVPLTGEN